MTILREYLKVVAILFVVVIGFASLPFTAIVAAVGLEALGLPTWGVVFGTGVASLLVLAGLILALTAAEDR